MRANNIKTNDNHNGNCRVDGVKNSSSYSSSHTDPNDKVESVVVNKQDIFAMIIAPTR